MINNLTYIDHPEWAVDQVLRNRDQSVTNPMDGD